MRLADVLLVNPVFDGLNLVAKEGPAVSERDAMLVLSRNAGVYEELGEAALGVNPFDVDETSRALERALEMPGAERSRRAARLKRAATSGTPEGWVHGQLAAAGLHL
jgi:trehalose 6-phosphate synthase